MTSKAWKNYLSEFLTAAALVFSVLAAGCDSPPNVLFVADSDAVNLLQLTDSQGDCAAMQHICYLTSWNGTTANGCWRRDGAYVQARFARQRDLLVPVGEFRTTEIANYTNEHLD